MDKHYVKWLLEVATQEYRGNDRELSALARGV